MTALIFPTPAPGPTDSPTACPALHEKGGCFHKYCRETRKAIANGSILNAELRVPDDSAMLLAHQR